MTSQTSPATADKKTPAHVAVIMDGNGRWAQRKGLPRVEGHRRGSEALKRTIQACMELGVKYLTVYAFSTENWNRPKEEVGFLMDLLMAALDKEIDELNKNGIRLRFFGRLEMIDHKLKHRIKAAEELTKNNGALNLTIMFSYGGRAEIVDAVKSIVNKGIKSDKISEETVSENIYTAELPDPDLLIRTAGEMRVSNFMLWQIAYSELWVTDTLWPDFGKEHLLQAIEDYGRRVRKYGGL